MFLVWLQKIFLRQCSMYSYTITKTLLLSFFCIFITFVFQLNAQESERLGVQDMTPILSKDLINQNVSVASKSLESIYDAPGVISVITSTEIERFGGNNLLEVLERVASVYAIGSYFAPNNVLSIRGDLATPYNNHVLILINGRPTREHLFGGIDYPVYLAFPLQVIESIEVVRGPGSVLYGTNAYSGVINIITKEVVEDQTQGSFEYGSFNTFGFNALSTKIRDRLKVSSAIRYFGQEGWQHEAVGEDGGRLDYQAGQSNLGASLNVDFGKLNMQSFVSYSSQSSTGVLPIGGTGLRNRAINTLRVFFDTGYNIYVSKRFKIANHATFNAMRTRFSNPSGDFVGNTKDVLLESTAFYDIGKGLNLTAGGTGYFQVGEAEIGDDANRGVPNYGKFWYNGYAQLDYLLPLKSKLKVKLTAGAQYNKPSKIKGDFVPRLGLIADFNKNLGLKLLYGQAFRAAFEAESTLNDPPVLQGQPGLRPEKVTTFDTQLFYSKGKMQIFATYFNSLQRDLIIQTTNISPTTYENANRLQLNGLEVEFKFATRSTFFITGSFTYQQNELTDTKDNSKIQDYTLMPQVMAKLGIFYDWREAGLSIGVFNTYMGEANNLEVPDNLQNPIPEAFNFMTVKVDMNLNDLFNITEKEETTITKVLLSFYVTNLLNEEIYYPEFVRRKINTLPGRGGRAFYTSFRVLF